MIFSISTGAISWSVETSFDVLSSTIADFSTIVSSLLSVAIPNENKAAREKSLVRDYKDNVRCVLSVLNHY